MIAGMFIAILCLGFIGCDQLKSTPQKWEYEILKGQRDTSGQLIGDDQGKLDKLGKDGWELVSVQADDIQGSTSTQLSLYFKRPLSQ